MTKLLIVNPFVPDYSSMGVARGITLGDYRKLMTLSVLLFGAISSVPGISSSGEEGKHDLHFLAEGSNTSPVPCPKKWVMKPYFEIFENLLDSHFQDFKEHKLSPCLCKALHVAQTTELQLSVLEQFLIGEGSHRRLALSMRINIAEKLKANPPDYSFEIIIIQRLPHGTLADPFELQHLLQRGEFSDVAVFGDTDLELPTVRSNRTAVEIHMDVDTNNLSIHKDGLEINLHIPLHSRYAPLDESGYTTVVFEEPDIFAGFSINGRPSTETCLSVLTRNSAESIQSPVAWKVPSGIEMHSAIVSTVTFLFATISAVLIILASIFHSDPKSCKTLKQS